MCKSTYFGREISLSLKIENLSLPGRFSIHRSISRNTDKKERKKAFTYCIAELVRVLFHVQVENQHIKSVDLQ